MQPTPAVCQWLIGCLLMVMSGSPAVPEETAHQSQQKPDGQSDLKPGEEVRLETPESGSYVLIYVPCGYTPERPWPVVFCYHGASGQATTWPFRQVTDGDGFIVVGMNYLRTEYSRTLAPDEAGPEIEYFAEASKLVAQRLQTDPRMLFMGGFSQGGYSNSVLGEQLTDQLAGLVILGAGRRNVDRLPANRSSLRRKPIFIGVGENDQAHNPHARRAARNYRAWGADVTFEEWPGLGHRPNQHSEKLRDWLVDHGPRQVFQADLGAARKAERSAKQGVAYEMYRRLSRFTELGDAASEAAAAADKLATQAESQLAEAEAAITKGEKAKAIALLKQISRRYDGTTFGNRATSRLNDLVQN